MRTWLCTIAVLAALASPLHAQESPQALQAAFVAAVKAGDVEALASLYTADAQTFPVTSMVASGRDGVREDWGPFLAENAVTDFAVTQQGSQAVGDVAVAWGLWTMTFVPKKGGDPVTMEGRFTDLSKKVGGKWYFLVDHASVPLPPPPAAE